MPGRQILATHALFGACATVGTIVAASKLAIMAVRIVRSFPFLILTESVSALCLELL